MTTPAELYRNAVDLNRFSNGVARRIALTYNDLILEAVDRLRGIDELSAPAKAARLRAILAQLKGSLDNWAGTSTLAMTFVNGTNESGVTAFDPTALSSFFDNVNYIGAVRDDADHAAAMEEHAIGAIDLVVVNLYPFEATVAKGAERDEIIENIDPKQAWPGLKLLMVSTTGEHAAWFTLDEQLKPRPAEMPAPVRHVVERIAENCEPALCTVLFMAGAGGSLRAGVTENPVRLTRSVRDTLTKVTLGGVPAYIWPGGGITLMVDVARMPEKSFGYVPTPALVAPIEFTRRADDYAALGGYASRAVTLEDVIARHKVRIE